MSATATHAATMEAADPERWRQRYFCLREVLTDVLGPAGAEAAHQAAEQLRLQRTPQS